MKTRALPFALSLAVASTAMTAVACYPDDEADDGGSSDAGPNRPGRPGTGDTGSPGDGIPNDASTDVATPDAPSPGPGEASFPTFAAAWTAYAELVAANAAYAACPCMIQFGMAASQADCESQLDGQLQPQLQCIEYALRQSEGSALGHLNCLVPLFEESNRCYDTADLDCLSPPPCEVDESSLAQCDERLTTAQRSAIEQCSSQ